MPLLLVLSLLVSPRSADPTALPPRPGEHACLLHEAREALRWAPSRRAGFTALRTEDVLREHAPWFGEETGPIAERIVSLADRHGLEPELILAVVQVESAFRPRARSRAGAVGLMQLLPSTGREVARDLGVPWHGRSTLHDPHRNLELGVAYLARLLDRYGGNEELALAAYNQGPGRVERLLERGRRVPLWYPARVLRLMDELREPSPLAAAPHPST